MIKNFEKNMSAYSFGHHQNFIAYITTLKRAGYSIEDVFRYVDLKRKELGVIGRKQKIPNQPCTECLGTMLLLPVNNDRGTQTGELTDKSVWICQNKDCMHTIYNKESVEELSKE